MHFAQWGWNALGALAALLPTADAALLSITSDNGKHDSRSLTIAETERVCNIPPMTPELWEEKKDDIDAWTRGILQRYRENPGTSRSFFSFVLETNFPSLVPAQTLCDIINECSPVSCTLFRDIFEWESQEKFEHERAMAIYTSNAMASYHNYYRYVRTAFTAAASSVDMMTDALWRDFSYVDNQAEHEKKKEADKKRIQAALSIGLMVVLLVTAVLTAGTGSLLATAAGGLAGAIPALAKTLPKALGPITEHQENWLKFGESVVLSGIASGGFAGSASIYGTQPAIKSPITPELLKAKEITFDRLWRDAALKAEKLLERTALGTMEGKEDGANGKNVLDALKDGRFYFPLEEGVQGAIREHLERELIAVSIGIVWSESSTNAWIVRAEVPAGQSCDQDARIHPMAKVCLPADPNSTYFVTATDSFNDQYLSEMHLPPGWRSLIEDPMKYGNLTVEEIVASSVQWWWETSERGILGPKGSAFNLTDFLGRIDRVGVTSVHLPVCNSPKGLAFSSLNQKPFLAYPCICSKADGSPDVLSNQSETLRVLMESGLIARDKVWTHCKDTLYCSGPTDGDNPWGVEPLSIVKGKKIHKGWKEEPFTSWGWHAYIERSQSTWGSSEGWDDSESGG